MSPAHLLVIRLSALGDVAMTLPAIYSLASQHPQLRITVLTRKPFAQLFISRPKNVEVIEADTKGVHRGLRGMWKLLRQLGGMGLTEVADLHNVLRSWIIDTFLRLKGCRVAMVDKQRAGRRSVLQSHRTQPDFTQRYAEVFARLGHETRLTFQSLSPDDLPACPVEVAQPSVGIAPFARYYNKVYPLELMEQVVDLLCRDGFQVYLFGARGKEAQQLDEWAKRYDRCTSLAGRYTLGEELAVMSRLSAMVSMDSANGHLASLTGVSVLTVWGSTSPACGFTPYRQPSSAAVCLQLPCQPCSIAGGERCPQGHFRCMRDLRPEELTERIKQLTR